jgi:exonuclease SbcC
VILLKVGIESFAGLAGREVELAEGLNVVLGPNEAGKSTLFQAIRHTLLTPAALKGRESKAMLEAFLPRGGGDSIACTLQFLHHGQRYLLAKRWGEGRSAELVRPDGSRLRGEEPIRAALAELLPAGEGTVRTVFLAAQSALPGTLRELAENPEAAGSLADLLRRAVLQPDGLSISAFQEKLAARQEELSGRWDPERGRPEGNRGPDNPWQKGAGQVTQSWYEREALERRRAEAEEAEARLGELARALQSCRGELAALERRLQEEAPAAQSVDRRSSLQKDLQLRQLRSESLRKAYEQWPRLERSLAEAARELPEAERRAAALRQEKARAEQAERRRQAREALEQARALEAEAAAARTRLAGLPAVSGPQLQELKKASEEAERSAMAFQAAGTGQGIAVSLQARADITLQVSKDGEPPQARTLGPGETLTLTARERARLEAPAWSLEAASAPEDRERLREKAESSRRRFADLLSSRGLASMEAADQASRDFELASARVQDAEERLLKALGGRSLEELEQAAAPAGLAAGPTAAEPARELSAVYAELAKAEDSLRRLKEREAADQETLTVLLQKHGSQDALLKLMLAETVAQQDVEARLASLPALPAQAADPDAFLAQHEAGKSALKQLGDRERKLSDEYAEAERQLPEESAEDLAVQLEDAERRHRQALRRADALRAVQVAAQAVLEQSGSGSQERFEGDLGRYAAELTAERYQAMPLEDGLPGVLERADGLRLPFDLLSGGTRGLFALALRLAMADAFLQDAEGFLILDDPLVDLDPDRQERASAVLARFASRPGRQLLLFTCHPAHAARFPDAHRVELAGAPA